MEKSKEVRTFFESIIIGLALFIITFMFTMNIVAFTKHKDTELFIILLAIILIASIVFIIAFVASRKSKNGENKPLGVVYRTNMSLRDSLVLMFKHKVCPYCNSKLKRVKNKSFVSERVSKIGHTYLHGKIYEIRVYFRCDKCSKDIRISEIGKKNN